ncbi:MAG: DUF2975 domain-containing protein [Proteobacteria bacterium]|nr:DUF2975 domain-containing protein [Pseudomonadota bacterium]
MERLIMERIQKYSQYLSYTFLAALILTPVKWIILWANINNEGFNNLYNFKSLIEIQIAPCAKVTTIAWNSIQKVMGFGSSFFYELMFWMGIFYLYKIFKNYQKAEIFTLQNGQYYINIGICFLLQGMVFRTLSDMFLNLAASLSNPPGQRMIVVGISNTNANDIILGAIIIVIAWVMKEAASLKEEQSLTV